MIDDPDVIDIIDCAIDVVDRGCETPLDPLGHATLNSDGNLYLSHRIVDRPLGISVLVCYTPRITKSECLVGIELTMARCQLRAKDCR